MKIEVGKFYRTRDGQKVGPMVRVPKDTIFAKSYVWAYEWDGSSTPPNRLFCEYGNFWDTGAEYELDLIAEWTDETAAPDTGTLRELNVQPGDVVENQKSKCRYMVAPDMTVGGPHVNSCIDDYKIISRSSRATPPSPVITETVTTQRIVPGQYGVLAIAGACSDCVELEFTGEYGPTGRSRLTRDELTAAIATLTQIRDALK